MRSLPSRGCVCRPSCGVRLPAQHYREHDGHSAARHLQREVLAGSPSMALRWTATAMHEAKKGFRG